MVAFLESPGSTSIISAVKVTGKTNDGLSVGLLQSLTGEETAAPVFDGLESRVPVAPTTNYVVGRVQKDWDKGNTILGGMFTSTHRWPPDDAALHRAADGCAHRHAWTLSRFFGDRSYVLEGKGCSAGSPATARPSRRCRPTPCTTTSGPTPRTWAWIPRRRRSPGNGGTVRVARYGNSKWRASDSARWMSPGLELNDVGYLRQADFILNETSVGFEEIEPRGALRTYGVYVERGDTWDFGGLHTDGVWTAEGHAQFANKWTLSAATHYVDTAVDTRLLRGGPAFAMQPFLSTSLSGSTDASRRAVVTLGTDSAYRADRGGAVRRGLRRAPAAALPRRHRRHRRLLRVAHR